MYALSWILNYTYLQMNDLLGVRLACVGDKVKRFGECLQSFLNFVRVAGGFVVVDWVVEWLRVIIFWFFMAGICVLLCL